jgi:hypothetical protein
MSSNYILWIFGSLGLAIISANIGMAQDAPSLDPDAHATAFEVSNVPVNKSPDIRQQNDRRVNNATVTPDLVAIWKTTARNLGITLLVFASVVFVGQFYLIAKSKNGWSDKSFKAFGLTLILVTAMFLVLIGFDDKQLAPMIGLLGTLAGYILGTGTKT